MFDLRQSKNGRPLLVGHRGAMDIAPENTMSAFRAGLAGGADILELDVQLTADKQVMVFHDTDLIICSGLALGLGLSIAEKLQIKALVTTFQPGQTTSEFPYFFQISPSNTEIP